MTQTTEDASSLGDKVFESNCKVLIPPQKEALDAVAEIWTKGVILKPHSGNTIYISYTDMLPINASSYHVSITTTSGLVITLSQFGTKYDYFSKKLAETWGDALAKALLMDESPMVYEARGFVTRKESSQTFGECRLKVCENSLLVLPSNSIPIRLPFSHIREMNTDLFKVNVSTIDGDLFEISRLGNATELFAEKLRVTMKNLEASSIETITKIIPSAAFEEVHQLSRLMIEGRAAPRNDVDKISPSLWAKLEKYIENSPLAESYNYLATIGERNLECIGLRKAMRSVYVWFMIPVMLAESSNGGNALVLEVTSETGHATYLFKVMSRNDFLTSRDKFMEIAETMIQDLNEAFIATGFRREPIYLSADELNTSEYSKYLYAASHLEQLLLLREKFFGRIMHNTLEQWKADLTDALHFNIVTKEEAARWSKSSLSIVRSQDETPQ